MGANFHLSDQTSHDAASLEEADSQSSRVGSRDVTPDASLFTKDLCSLQVLNNRVPSYILGYQTNLYRGLNFQASRRLRSYVQFVSVFHCIGNDLLSVLSTDSGVLQYVC